MYKRMNDAGWMSWPLATSCHAALTEKPIAALRQTRTYREFAAQKKPPVFDLSGATLAYLLHIDGKLPILVNAAQGVIRNEKQDHGQHNVAYLEDVRPNCILPRT